MSPAKSSQDLGAIVRELTGDVSVLDENCRDMMHDMGITRYEDLTHDDIDKIATAWMEMQ